MAQVSKSIVKERNNEHAIAAHAIERLREYGTDIAQSAPNVDLHNILCEELSRQLKARPLDAYKFIDDSNKSAFAVPFENDFWAESGLFMIAYANVDGKPFQIRTLLTANAVERGRRAAQESASLGAPPRITALPDLPRLTPVSNPAPSPRTAAEDLLLLKREGTALLPITGGNDADIRKAVLVAVLQGTDPEHLVVYRKHGEIKLDIAIG